MSESTVRALHTVSGQVADLPKRIVDHPILGKYLTAVADDAKSYAPELYKPKTVEEFTEKPRRFSLGGLVKEPVVIEDEAPVTSPDDSNDEDK